jgi:hypothetical protein
MMWIATSFNDVVRFEAHGSNPAEAIAILFISFYYFHDISMFISFFP